MDKQKPFTSVYKTLIKKQNKTKKNKGSNGFIKYPRTELNI